MGRFDSKADGFVVNPYYGSKRSIATFDRRFIRHRKRLIDVVQAAASSGIRQAGWEARSSRDPAFRIGPGDFYLVLRLDGRSAADAIAAIDRAQDLKIDRSETVVVLDANLRSELDKADYREAALQMRRGGWRVLLERTDTFLTGADLDRPVIAYASYGQNDAAGAEPLDVSYIATFDFARGAIFNTLESFNGRDFGGAGNLEAAPQTQLSDFIAAGGTFGIGNVWEPFSFSAADNVLLLDAFLNRGMTFAEAAYSSLQVLSWQQIVVGDPLARMEIVGDPAPQPASGTAGSGR